MESTVTCPSCHTALQVSDDQIGRTVKCPRCEQTFVLEADPESPAAGEVTRPSLPPPSALPPSPAFGRQAAGLPYRGHGLKPHRGGLVLVFGILGLVVCAPFGLAAWLMGNSDLAEMRAGVMDPAGEATTSAGRILGII